MKTMIPAAAGTYLLVPFLDFLDFGTDDVFYDKTRVPILGWTNYSAEPTDEPGLRTRGTPIVPFWPEGVSQAAGYLIPDGDGGFSISVPFARRVFSGANGMNQYDHFAEELLRAMEEAKKDGEEPRDLQVERREDRDEAPDELHTISVELPTGTYTIPHHEDAREVGSTGAGGARRTKEEIAADELFLEIVKGLGKTIRAVNTRWKSTPSRTAVLKDLAGVKDRAEEDDTALAAALGGDDDEDEDLIG